MALTSDPESWLVLSGSQKKEQPGDAAATEKFVASYGLRVLGRIIDCFTGAGFSVKKNLRNSFYLCISR